MRREFEEGKPLVWHFTKSQPRLRFTLPKAFGGGTQDLSLEGSYSFTPLA